MLERELDDAIHDENHLLVTEILDKGANPNILIDNTYTLNDAIFYVGFDGNENSLQTVHSLLQHGANANTVESIDSFSPIQYATSMTNINLITLLLSYGANPNTKYPYDAGLPILQICVDTLKETESVIHVEILNILFTYGAKATINESSSSWQCPSLFVAIQTSALMLIELIIDNGADTIVKDSENNTILEILKQNKTNYSDKDYTKLKTLLNPNNSPYLHSVDYTFHVRYEEESEGVRGLGFASGMGTDGTGEHGDDTFHQG